MSYCRFSSDDFKNKKTRRIPEIREHALIKCACGNQPREESRYCDRRNGAIYYWIECSACGERTAESLQQNLPYQEWQAMREEAIDSASSDLNDEYNRLIEERIQYEEEIEEAEQNLLDVEREIKQVEKKAGELGVELLEQ